MKPYSTALFFIALFLITDAANAQFPTKNFGNRMKTGTTPVSPTGSVLTDQLNINVTPPLNVSSISNRIATYKSQIDKFALNDASDYAQVDSYYASQIVFYLSKAESVVKGYITTVQAATIATMADITNNDAVLLQLRSLDAYMAQIIQQYAAMKDLMTTKNGRHFFPSKNYQYAKVVYGTLDSTNFSLGNSFTFMGTDNQAAVNPEIVSGYFGPVRVSINTLISTTKDTSVSAQSKLRLISGGGNTAIAFSYALYRYVSPDVELFVHLNPKFIADFPLLGASSLTKGQFIGSVSVAPEAFFKVYTNEKNLGFFGDVRAATIFGTSQYLSNLNLSPKTHHFDFGQINAGFFVSASFQVSVTAPLYASSGSLLSMPVLLTTQFFPGASSSKK